MIHIPLMDMVLSQDVDPDSILFLVRWVVDQLQDGNKTPLIGVAIMVFLFYFNKFWSKKIPSNKMPVVSAILGVVSTCAINTIAFASGSTTKDWTAAVISGIISGTSASGFWSLVGKDLSKVVHKE